MVAAAAAELVGHLAAAAVAATHWRLKNESAVGQFAVALTVAAPLHLAAAVEFAKNRALRFLPTNYSIYFPVDTFTQYDRIYIS